MRLSGTLMCANSNIALMCPTEELDRDLQSLYETLDCLFRLCIENYHRIDIMLSTEVLRTRTSEVLLKIDKQQLCNGCRMPA